MEMIKFLQNETIFPLICEYSRKNYLNADKFHEFKGWDNLNNGQPNNKDQGNGRNQYLKIHKYFKLFKI